MHLIDVLASDGRPTDLDEITLDDVVWLSGALEVKDSTKAIYLQTLSRASVARGGPDWYKQSDILLNRRNPMRIWITMDEFVRLYKRADPTDRLILVLGAYMGLRRTEIANLRDGDYDEHRRTLTVRGKGHGENGLVEVMDVPLPVAREIAGLRAWIGTMPRMDDKLVQSRRWHGQDAHGLSPQRVAERVRALGDRVGVEVRTHSLRRLYATTLVNTVGASYDTTRRLMRHANIETTLRCYVQADPSLLKDATDALMRVYGAALGF